MQKVLEWFSINNGFVITIAIVFFVLLVAILLIALMSSNSLAKKQIALLTKTAQSDHRPKIIPKLITLDEKTRCLAFENIGSQYAKNLHIKINDEWLEAKVKLPDFQSNNDILQQLAGKKITLCPDEQLIFALYNVGAAGIELFKCQPLKITMAYNDNSGRIRYEESFILDLSVYDDMFASSSDYIRGANRLSEKLERVENALKDIDYRISEVSNTNKRMLDFKIRAHMGEKRIPIDDDKKRKKK